MEGSEPSQPTMVPSGIMLAPFFVVPPPSGGVAVYVAENPVLGGPWWSQRPMRAQGAFHVGLL